MTFRAPPSGDLGFSVLHAHLYAGELWEAQCFLLHHSPAAHKYASGADRAALEVDAHSHYLPQLSQAQQARHAARRSGECWTAFQGLAGALPAAPWPDEVEFAGAVHATVSYDRYASMDRPFSAILHSLREQQRVRDAPPRRVPAHDDGDGIASLDDDDDDLGDLRTSPGLPETLDNVVLAPDDPDSVKVPRYDVLEVFDVSRVGARRARAPSCWVDAGGPWWLDVDAAYVAPHAHETHPLVTTLGALSAGQLAVDSDSSDDESKPPASTPAPGADDDDAHVLQRWRAAFQTRCVAMGNSVSYQLGFHVGGLFQSRPRVIPRLSPGAPFARDADAVAPTFKVVATERHSAALTVDGQLYVWGTGSLGRLGLGNMHTQVEPALLTVRHGDDTPARLVDVSVGGAASAAVSSIGECFAWGTFKAKGLRRGHQGDAEASTGDAAPAASPPSSSFSLSLSATPTLLLFPRATRIRSVSVAFNHAVLLSTRGELFSIGQRMSNPRRMDRSPHRVRAVSDWHMDMAVASPTCILVLTSQGQLFQQLLGAKHFHRVHPRAVSGAVRFVQDPTAAPLPSRPLSRHAAAHASTRVIKLDCSPHRAVALTSCGRVFTWTWSDSMADLEALAAGGTSPTVAPLRAESGDLGMPAFSLVSSPTIKPSASPPQPQSSPPLQPQTPLSLGLSASPSMSPQGTPVPARRTREAWPIPGLAHTTITDVSVSDNFVCLTTGDRELLVCVEDPDDLSLLGVGQGQDGKKPSKRKVHADVDSLFHCIYTPEEAVVPDSPAVVSLTSFSLTASPALPAQTTASRPLHVFAYPLSQVSSVAAGTSHLVAVQLFTALPLLTSPTLTPVRIPTLASLAEAHLCLQLTPDNAVQAFSTACRLRLPLLLEACARFLLANAPTLMPLALTRLRPEEVLELEFCIFALFPHSTVSRAARRPRTLVSRVLHLELVRWVGEDVAVSRERGLHIEYMSSGCDMVHELWRVVSGSDKPSVFEERDLLINLQNAMGPSQSGQYEEAVEAEASKSGGKKRRRRRRKQKQQQQQQQQESPQPPQPPNELLELNDAALRKAAREASKLLSQIDVIERLAPKTALSDNQVRKLQSKAECEARAAQLDAEIARRKAVQKKQRQRTKEQLPPKTPDSASPWSTAASRRKGLSEIMQEQAKQASPSPSRSPLPGGNPWLRRAHSAPSPASASSSPMILSRSPLFGPSSPGIASPTVAPVLAPAVAEHAGRSLRDFFPTPSRGRRGKKKRGKKGQSVQPVPAPTWAPLPCAGPSPSLRDVLRNEEEEHAAQQARRQRATSLASRGSPSLRPTASGSPNTGSNAWGYSVVTQTERVADLTEIQSMQLVEQEQEKERQRLAEEAERKKREKREKNRRKRARRRAAKSKGTQKT